MSIKGTIKFDNYETERIVMRKKTQFRIPESLYKNNIKNNINFEIGDLFFIHGTNCFIEILAIQKQKLKDISEAEFIEEGCPEEFLLGSNWFYPQWEKLFGELYLLKYNPDVLVFEFKVSEEIFNLPPQ